MTAAGATRPEWVSDFTAKVPRELDLSRPFLSCDEVFPDPINESKLTEDKQDARVCEAAVLPFPIGSAFNDWKFVGLTSRKRFRWRWWLGKREWVVTFYFQAQD